MQGKTHKAIGTVAGLCVAYYGFSTGNEMLMLTAISAPLGAMLPDIDHDQSKLGRNRKKVFDTVNVTIKTIVAVAIIGYLVLCGLEIYTNYKETGLNIAIILSILKSLIPIAPLVICTVIATNPVIKKHTAFYKKHRGIMHTLFVPAGITIGSLLFQNEFVVMLLYGLSLGYLSHLFADLETTRGCPILWPISTECVNVLKVTTGTVWEYIVAAIDIGAMICVTYYLVR